MPFCISFFQKQEPVHHDERPRIALKKTKTSYTINYYSPAEPLRFPTTIASINRVTFPSYEPAKVVKKTESKVACDVLGLFAVTETMSVPSATETIRYKRRCIVSEEMEIAQAKIAVTLELMDSDKKIIYTKTVRGQNTDSLSIGQEIEVSPRITESDDNFVIDWVLCTPVA